MTSNKRKPAGELHAHNDGSASVEAATSKRFQCSHDGCGKSYSRAEHLARHQLNREPPFVRQGSGLTENQMLHAKSFAANILTAIDGSCDRICVPVIMSATCRIAKPACFPESMAFLSTSNLLHLRHIVLEDRRSVESDDLS